MHRRAQARAPAGVLGQYARDGFCRPAAVNQRTSVAIDAHLLAAAEGFDAIELSPVAPLGACSADRASPIRIASSPRFVRTEIVSDPTNVLALECALGCARPRRRRSTSPRATRHPGAAHPQAPRLRAPLPDLRPRERRRRNPGPRVHRPGARFAHHARCSARSTASSSHGYAFGARRVDILRFQPERDASATASRGNSGPSPRASSLEHAYYSGGLSLPCSG